MDYENSLVQQIDEIKEIAQQLQARLQNKEIQVEELDSLVEEKRQKADELETLVRQNEVKVQELEELIEEKQVEADSIFGDIQKSVEQKFTDQTELFQQNLTDQKTFMEQATVRQMEQMDEMRARLLGLESGFLERVQEANARNQRNTQVLFDELNEKVDALREGQEYGINNRKYLVPILGLAVLGFLGMVFTLLYQSGFFSTIF